MIPRQAADTVKMLCRGFPVVAVTGPRQSGKTTLVRHLFKDRPYISLENPDHRDFAQQDPRGFLNQYKTGAVFDEAQRSPQLFSYLQEIVDTQNVPGRFILTGSQQFGLMGSISQSLAGRVAKVHLMPFALKELYPDFAVREKLSLDRVLFSGFYPPIHDRDLAPGVWLTNYIETYIERDVRQLVNIKDLNTFRRFLRLCAGRTGQLVNLSDLAADTGVTHNTIKSWLSILEASYIIFLLPPHHRNFNKRIIKTPKLYFFDTGLCTRLLAVSDVEQIHMHSMRGALFESFVISEIIKSRFHRGTTDPLYFWRDRSGNEIDLVVENGEALIPVEIKSGATINRDFLKGLHRWTHLAGDIAADPTLIYGGIDMQTRSGIRVFPWHFIPEINLGIAS